MSAIYLIHAKGTDLYKIGLTSGDPIGRLSQLQTASPHELCIKYDCECGDNGPVIESYLHGYYKDFHVRGEWFQFDHDGVDRVEAHMMQIGAGYALEQAVEKFDIAMYDIGLAVGGPTPMQEVAIALRELCYHGAEANEEGVAAAISSLLSFSRLINRGVYRAAVGVEVDENGDEV